jgi:hypothetical protein
MSLALTLVPALLQPAGASIKLKSKAAVPHSVACSGTDAKVSDPAGPHGLFELGALGAGIKQYAMRSPLLCGADVFVNWSSIDNGIGASPRYNWSHLDADIAPWEAAGKEIALIVSGASEGGTADTATPSYVTSRVDMVRCTAEPPVPVFWQPSYLSNWESFIQATVQHFAADPHIAYLRFGLSVDGEGYIPGVHDTGTCLTQWNAFGYATQWAGYTQDLLKFEGTLHSPHQILAALDYDDMPTTGAQATADGVGVGIAGLDKATATAVLDHQACPIYNWCAAFTPLAGKSALYLQEYQYSDPSGSLHLTPPSNQELTGPLPPLLQAGMKMHAQLLEIYPEDWLLALDPQYPNYGRYHTEYLNALKSAAAVVN